MHSQRHELKRDRSRIMMCGMHADLERLPSRAQPSLLFGSAYYAGSCGPIPYERNGHWLHFFSSMAEEIARSLRPRTVFDAGCAWGFLVESFWDRGIEARGVDISAYAIGKVRPDIAEYCSVASLTEQVKGGPFDLVTCIEVLEHMPANEARKAIENMTQATECILFSSTPDDFTEPTHVNVRAPFDWLKLFAERQFHPDLAFDASFVAPHAMLLRRNADGLPEGAALLFCEVLRHRKDRAAFLNRQLRLETLERETASLGQRLHESEKLASEKDRLAAGLLTASGENELLSGRLNDLERSISEARNHESRLMMDLEASESARRNTENAATELRRQWAAEKLQYERAAVAAEEWIAKASDLTDCVNRLAAERDAVRFQLDSMCSGPGWMLLERYRGWLRKNRWRHRWVDQAWEPAVQWALRRMRLTRPASRTPLALPPQAQVAARPVTGTKRVLAGPQDLVPPKAAESNSYATWILETEPAAALLAIQRDVGACFSYRPTISVLVPVYRVPLTVLREMVESVIAQTYENWELCVAMACPDDLECLGYLEGVSRSDSRIRLIKLERNEGISGNSNRALALASGEFIALLDHDDRLARFALFEVVQLLNQDRAANFIYSDKDQLTEAGGDRIQPLFKPQWSPDLMLNANYLTHLSVMRTAHVRAVGGWRKETDGAQDWDIFLRVIQSYGKVRHIPKVLYHWRQIATSVAAGGLQAKPYAAAGQIRAVSDHLAAMGLHGFGLRHEQGNLRVEWPVPDGQLVSIIFLAAIGDQSTLDRATQIAGQTDHPAFEIVVPVASGQGQGAVRAVRTHEHADLRERIDAAVKSARGTVLVFLDEAATPADREWLKEITGPLQLPGVGLVGARLNDSRTGAIRHCGVVFTPDGRCEYVHAGYPDHVYEQFGAASWYRDWSAVSGTCFAMASQLWADVGGLEDPILHPRLDLHLCLKVRIQKDARIFYNPHARLLQDRDSVFESSLGGPAGVGADFIRACFADGDPYFNPNLDCQAGKLLYTLPQHTGQAPSGTSYAAESQALVQIFDCSPAQIARSRKTESKPRTQRMETVTWFLPDFNNPFYGGIHTILRFADAFQRRHGVKSTFCILGHALESVVSARIASAFPELAASCELFVVDDPAKVRQLPGTDSAVCSLWTTAYAALEFDAARRKFYFIQDDETLFYPAGSTSALVEASYGFGFHGLCNTPSLLDHYRARGGEGKYFIPCIDPAVFHDRERRPPRQGPPYTLFCYARPSHPRNCFELLSSTLKKLKRSFGEDLTIITAGAEWDLRAHGLEGIVQHLGLLNYQTTGALYRACDAGLVMMMTRHPSYLPMELMACGSLVITNRNPDTAWLLQDGDNCLLAAPTATSLANRVEEGLKDSDLRRRVTANAQARVQGTYQDWDAATDEIYVHMRSLC